MRIRYLITAELFALASGPRPGAESFRREFAAYRTAIASHFRFDRAADVDRAEARLRELGLAGSRFYEFELPPQELAAHPAVYLGIDSVDDLLDGGEVDPENLGERELAVDFASRRLFARDRARACLSRHAPDLTWNHHSGGPVAGLYEIRIGRALPEPIAIPLAVEVNENPSPPGVHSVRSDGRDVITDGNARFLRRAGLAISRSAAVDGRVLTWPDRLVASGALMSDLLDAGIEGVLEPLAPLLPASHPLAL